MLRENERNKREWEKCLKVKHKVDTKRNLLTRYGVFLAYMEDADVRTL